MKLIVKTALVTDGARGIAGAVVREFTKKGALEINENKSLS